MPPLVASPMFTGLCLQRQAQESAILLDQIVIVDAAARHGEDDEVIVDRLGFGGGSKA